MISFSKNSTKLDKMIASLSNISVEQAQEMQYGNTLRWICSILRISGSHAGKRDVMHILDGEKVDSATLQDYDLVRATAFLRDDFTNMLDMDIRLNAKEIGKIYMRLTGAKAVEYRRSNQVIDGLHKLPPHSSKIPELMRNFELETLADAHYNVPFEGAVNTASMILAIWPFEKMSEIVAYAALSYELLRGGYPLPTLDIRRDEFMTFCGQIVAGDTRTFIKTLVENGCEECRMI